MGGRAWAKDVAAMISIPKKSRRQRITVERQRFVMGESPFTSVILVIGPQVENEYIGPMQ
jgi:hypothetical protein